MVSDEASLTTLARKWNGPSYWSPAIGRRGGVAILCSPRQRENILVWQKDAGSDLSVCYLREAARIFRESKISNEKSNFFLFYQNIPFCELVSKKIF